MKQLKQWGAVRQVVALVLVAMGVLVLPRQAQAVYLVWPAQKAETTITNDSTCNLSDAIDSVQQGASLHGCTGPVTSDIWVEANAPITYKISNWTYVTKNMSIYGVSSSGLRDVTIQFTGTGDVFTVASGKTLHIENLSMSHVNGTGRFVLSNGRLELSYVKLSNGGAALTGIDALYGGAVRNIDGALIIDRSTFSTNHGKYGGAIYSTAPVGPVTIRESVFSSNSAELDGGAIWSTGAYGIDIMKTTINSNTATRSGGGLVSSGRAWIATTTISSNTASTGTGGGINVTSGANNYLELFFCTIAYNSAAGAGGGVSLQTSSNTRTDHSIVSNNTDNGTAPDYYGNPQLSGFVKSLFGKKTGIVQWNSGNIEGGAKLTALANNQMTGSPILKTHRIQSTSSAVDVVSFADRGTAYETDERSYYRPCSAAGGFCDLGAFERQSIDP